MKWLKRLFVLIVVAALCTVIWFSFAVWTGIYSVYTLPPSTDNPDGTTLIVSREEGEPMFNSPNAKIPPPPPKEKSSGLTFGTARKPHRPLRDRTVLELPYIDWAYQKSLEP
jgi:hypothetical protein